MLRTRVPRRLSVLLTTALVAVPLTACSGEGAISDMEPDEVLSVASDKLTETEGVRLHLSTDNLPDGVTGITKAEGVATNAPAFDGTISVVLSGTSVDVAVIAVDGTVHAELPFTPGWNVVDPGEYGAPDPATLINSDTGFPALLEGTEGPTEGDSVRGGEDNRDVLTTYTGTVTGEAMKAVIPSSAGDSFDVEWQVTDEGELRKAVLNGIFYADSDEMTYTVTFEDYGIEQEIVAP